MACVNSRIFFSDCGYDPARTPGRFFCGEAWQRLAVVAAIVHQRPSANLLPAWNVNPFTSFQQESTRCFLCTMTLVSIQRSTSPSNVQASNHLRIRQLLMSSAESELSFRSQLCPGKWQEDSVIFSLLPLMSAVTSYYLVRLLSYLPQFNADRNQEDELEGKTMQLRYNISRRGKMHASCGNILYRIIGGRHEGSSRTIASNSL